MMKFIFFMIFTGFMMFKNKMIMFYYNLLFMLSVMVISSYMFKVDMMMIMISLSMGVNYYAFFLIVLCVWVISLMFMSLSYMKNDKMNIEMKMFIFMFMLLILMGFFMSLNLLMFYFFFEVSLIPTFFLVVYWGFNPERFSAAFYFMMYTLLISLPFLFYIFKLFNLFYSFSFDIMEVESGKKEMNFKMWSFFIIFSSFLIKLPMYMFHIWLPKAHVEAPVYGSMLLAAILLKLGGYGILRLLFIFCMEKECLSFFLLIFSLSIMGALLVSILCLIQIDMKSLVAYSSVVHMNFLLCSIVTMMKMGVLSSLITMISHGLCSSGLFFMVNLYYLRSSSRFLLLNKGMLNLYPAYSIWWFLLCAANFSFPFSLNFMGEMLMISVIIGWEIYMILYLMLICLFSSSYSLYLYSYVQHGNMGSGSYLGISMFSFMDLIKEFMILILHFYPLLVLLLNLVLF